MGIIDLFKKPSKESAREISLTNLDSKASSNNMPYLTNWMYATKLGKPRGINIPEIRQYAKCAWVQMVTKAIIKQIKSTDWKIVPIDEESDEQLTDQIDYATNFLNFPNANKQTFGDLWGAYLHDVLEIDAGIIWKGKDSKSRLSELYCYDAASFLVDLDEHGRISGYYQYSFRAPNATPLKYSTDELIYGVMSTNTEFFPYGWSPLMSVLQEAELLINGTRWNKEFFLNNAIPDGAFMVKMDKDQMDRLESIWHSKIKGQPHKFLFLNGEGEFQDFTKSNRDMEWLAGQKWYFHLIFAAYGLSPAEVGFYEDVNRSAQEGQERTTVKNAIRPYLQHIADKINREILPDLLGTPLKVKFKWFPKDHVAEEIEHKQTIDKLNSGVYTINEVRRLEGKESVEWGDKPMNLYQQERFTELTNQKEDEPKKKPNFENNTDESDDDEDEDLDKSYKSENYEVIEDANDYNEFLKKNMDYWEESILKALDKHLKDEVKEYDTKTFSQFISRVFNVVNTANFLTGLKKVIKVSMTNGVKDAEQELNLDIGVSDMFNNQVKYNADRQLEGFNINGKRWHGLKGVARNLQVKIYKTVQEGLMDKKGLDDISSEIKDIMSKEKGGMVKGEVTEGRSMKIARTESGRFRNSGRLQAYMDSGLKGKKKWVALLDSKTSDICKRLNGQEVELNGYFKDSLTGKEFLHPPANVNCRSVLQFVFTE